MVRAPADAPATGALSCAGAGPMVRSSYRAGEFYLKNVLRGQQQQQPAAVAAGE